MALAYGVDVGGSSIKYGVVDTASATIVHIGSPIDTPTDFTVDNIVSCMSHIVATLDSYAESASPTSPRATTVGIGFPTAVSNGVCLTHATAHQHPGFKGTNLAAAIATEVRTSVTVANDADCAGLAEVNALHADERQGTVMVFTLGTGIGSALIRNGTIVPNLELGHLYLRGQHNVAEQRAAGRIRHQDDLTIEQYGKRLSEYFTHIERLFSPDTIIIGGGVSEHFDTFAHLLSLRASVRKAQFENDAGIVGAALRTQIPHQPT